MPTLEALKTRVEQAVPGARLEVVPNDSAAGQPSIRVDADHAPAVARFLRDDPELHFDYCSNVTGIDRLDTTLKRTASVRRMVAGEEREFQEIHEQTIPGCLEVVYHLYSMRHKHGPVILRLRTENRSDRVHLPSLTPVWRGCEFQEREVYDLFGVVFDGHPDLRRILMWDGFQDHPMRKDYREPDDYEYEPTPHDRVLERAQSRPASKPGDAP
jgi:NADH-quinone oxidoreductase subunit C